MVTAVENGPFYVYAYLYDERVVYVGQSRNLEQREVAHRAARWWRSGLTREIWGEHETRADAIRHERELIRDLQPEGNSVHNPNGRRFTGSAISMTRAAERIGIDRGELKKLTEAGEIPYWFRTAGGRYMFSAETIEEHKRLAAHRNSKAAS